MARAELKPGIAGLQVQRTDHCATLPPPQSFRLVKLLLGYSCTSKHISINDFYLLVVIVKKLPHSLPSHLVAMFSHSNLVTIFSLTILFIVTRVCYLPPWPFQSLPLTLMSHLREAVSRLTVSFCSSYASPFALLLEKVLVNGKITALCQTNMATKNFIKHYKQQKWILKNC